LIKLIELAVGNVSSFNYTYFNKNTLTATRRRTCPTNISRVHLQAFSSLAVSVSATSASQNQIISDIAELVVTNLKAGIVRLSYVISSNEFPK
jgi:hypothetical protein